MKLTAALLLFLLNLTLDGWASIKSNNTNFATLYNEHRFSQPINLPWAGSYWPHANHGIAAKTQNQALSATEKLDSLLFKADQSTNWEMKNHSCDAETGRMKSDCESWWGHCDGWAAAAIMEAEPRKAITVSGVKFTVADQKALLTELWMENENSAMGVTQKDAPTDDWVFDPDNSISRRRVPGTMKTYYDAFWDVSPRQFFLALTNQIGILGKGLGMDRFTGEEIWNQPILGYRILPLKKADLLKAENLGTKTIYPVFVKVKLYWASDFVEPGHVSGNFDIAQTSDSEELEEFANREFEARLHKFKLFLDAPVRLTGGTIVSDGKPAKIVGSGIWDEQEHPETYFLNDTHPDLLWSPDNLVEDESWGYGNPYVRARTVRKIIPLSESQTEP